MELIFNSCGEFRWSPEGPAIQIHSPHLHIGAPGIFFFRSFRVCSNAKESVGCGKKREATAPIESLVKLQPRFLCLRWKTLLWQNCSLGSSACSEGLALGQNTLKIMKQIYDILQISFPTYYRDFLECIWIEGCMVLITFLWNWQIIILYMANTL